jgi:hypothetical protein
MQPLNLVDPWYYATVYYILFLILSWATVLYYIGSNQQKILHSEGSSAQGAALLLTLVLIFFLGLRPMSSQAFGDMPFYAHSYQNVISSYSVISFKSEWLWNNLAFFCKQVGFSVYEYFLIIEFGYFFGMLICALLLMRKNLWIAILFFYTSFSCYTFGVNGIRNGLACSLDLIAISLFALGGPKRPAGLVLMALAMGFHRSSALPSAAAIASLYFVKDTKTAIRFWIASIAISLAAGPLVERFFAALGFDDRLSDYASTNQEKGSMDQFSQAGFRWDFLLYSSGAVAMIWYVTRYRKFKDSVYTILANSYLLCNAFWIMVIRSAFSNRFAYLSWFLYPVVMAYPLLRMNLWKDQDRKTALIFFLYSGFTLFMFFIFYFGTSEGFRGFDLYWWKREY